MSPLAGLGIAWVVAALAMAGLWSILRARQNESFVDVVWAFGVGAIGVTLAGFASGDPARRALIAALVGVWSLRLGTHLWSRLARTGPDGRYLELQERWGADAARKMFGFFQLQAFWCVLFAAPPAFAAQNAAPFPTMGDVLGIALFGVSLVGEAIADRQLARFRARPENRGRVCRVGLWSWSRHPNYFFEWLHWWAYVALAWGSPWVFPALLGPLAMFYLLRCVTGVPPAEARALRTRGEAYRAYQATTNAFFPWPPRAHPSSEQPR